MIGHRNTIVSHFADGHALLYGDANGTLLPLDGQVVARTDTIYDLASLSKLFCTVIALDQIGKVSQLKGCHTSLSLQGLIDVNATVTTYLPEFAANGKGNITILQLMTHTSGFDADPSPPLYPSYTTYAERKTAIITQKLINPPGEH